MPWRGRSGHDRVGQVGITGLDVVDEQPQVDRDRRASSSTDSEPFARAGHVVDWGDGDRDGLWWRCSVAGERGAAAVIRVAAVGDPEIEAVAAVVVGGRRVDHVLALPESRVQRQRVPPLERPVSGRS